MTSTSVSQPATSRQASRHLANLRAAVVVVVVVAEAETGAVAAVAVAAAATGVAVAVAAETGAAGHDLAAAVEVVEVEAGAAQAADISADDSPGLTCQPSTAKQPLGCFFTPGSSNIADKSNEYGREQLLNKEQKMWLSISSTPKKFTPSDDEVLSNRLRIP